LLSFGSIVLKTFINSPFFASNDFVMLKCFGSLMNF
jgi:hypothetical protein